MKELKDNNVKVLQDENVLIDNRFCIIGRQDCSEEVEKNKGRATMSELTSSLDDSKFSIVMNN